MELHKHAFWTQLGICTIVTANIIKYEIHCFVLSKQAVCLSPLLTLFFSALVAFEHEITLKFENSTAAHSPLTALYDFYNKNR